MSKQYIKIWLNTENDLDLIEWWKSLPSGERSKIGRDILRAYKDNSANPQAIDLGAIRQIFESVLDSKLSNLSFVQHPQDKDEQENDPLQSLDDSFLLE